MSEVINPYASPVAAVSDVQAYGDAVGFQPVKLFSAQGRIGRLRFITYLFAGIFLFFLAVGLLAFAIFFAAASSVQNALVIAVVLLIIPLYFFIVLCTIQRSHDMDWSGWTALLTFIPMVGGFIALLWYFVGGTPGMNRFGAPPPPNPLSVRIVGLWLPLVGLALMVVGIAVAVAVAASSPEFMQGFKNAFAEARAARAK